MIFFLYSNSVGREVIPPSNIDVVNSLILLFNCDTFCLEYKIRIFIINNIS